jgi:hypothetical protein
VGGSPPASAGTGGVTALAGKPSEGGSVVVPAGGSAGAAGAAGQPSGGGGAGGMGGAGGKPPMGGSAGAPVAGSAGAGGTSGCPAFACLTVEQCAGPGFTSVSTAPVYDPKTECFNYEATCYPVDFPEECVPEKCWRAEKNCL